MVRRCGIKIKAKGDMNRHCDCFQGVRYQKVSHPDLGPKPDAHRIYAQDQVIIHTARM
jgi:hypothetical protein